MPPSRRNRILIVLFVGVLMGALDIAIVGPALPALKAHFGVDERRLAWVFAVYVLASLVSTPLMAKLSDRQGRRRIYVLDIALFAAGSLVVATAPTFGVVLAGRAVQGLGAGGNFPVAAAVIGDTFPEERRGRALGLIGAVFGLAFLVGPVVGGVLLAVSGWRALFVVNLPVAALVIAAAWRVLPAGRPARARPFDVAGMVTLAALLAALAYGVSQLEAGAGRLPIRSAAWLGLAAALTVVFVRLEGRAADPVLRPGLFAPRHVKLVGLLAAGTGIAEAAVVFVPDLLVEAFGVAYATASFMLLPVVLAMAVGAPVAGRALDRVGPRPVVLTGSLLLTGGTGLAGLVSTDVVRSALAGLLRPAGVALATRTLDLIHFYGAAALVGLGLSVLLGAPLRYVMLAAAPAEERGASQGVVTLLTGVGQLVGGAFVGATVASIGGVAGYRAALLVVAGIAAGMVGLSLGLPGRQHRRRMSG